MTTPYSVSRNLGSLSYNNYVHTPINGPLNTNQYPGIVPRHNNGLLKGLRPTPPQYYPLQEPVRAEMNTNARHQYLRTSLNTTTKVKQNAEGKLSTPNVYSIASSQRRIPVSSHTNYIAPLDNSSYINILKSNAVGQTAYKVNLPNEHPIGTKSYYPSGTRSALRRARSGGSVAPKKKGAIENVSLKNGKVWGWGSIPRQNY